MSWSDVPATPRTRPVDSGPGHHGPDEPRPVRMSFAEAVRSCFRRYVTFSGRASRPEYWWFVLFVILGSIVAGILDGILFGMATVQTGSARVAAQSNGPITAIFNLATFLPLLAAGWRRMHDTGRAGLYLFYPIIAMIGTMSFAAILSGGNFDAFMGGQIGLLAGVVLVIAFLVCLISPLIVIWWLTRPTQPAPNQWGAAPRGPA